MRGVRRAAILLALMSAAVGLLACGGGGSTDTDTSSGGSATSTPAKHSSTGTQHKKGSGAQQKPVHLAATRQCVRKAGARVTKGVEKLPSGVADKATMSVVIGFPDKKFGASVQNVQLLVYSTPAATQHAFKKVRSELKDRRLALRNQLIVIFGQKLSQKAAALVVRCLPSD